MNTPLTSHAPPSTGNWRDHAACLQVDCGDAFFPEKGESVREPKAICARCPVIEACLRFALDHAIDVGVFGGTSGRERKLMRSAANRTQRAAA